eukprot:s568_g11.t1
MDHKAKQSALSNRRAGKEGSHLLRGVLRELPDLPAPSRGEQHVEAQDWLPGHMARKAGGSKAYRGLGLMGPLLMGSGIGSSISLGLRPAGRFDARMAWAATHSNKWVAACAPQEDGVKLPQANDEDEDALATVCDRLLLTPERPQTTLTAEAETLRVPRSTLRRDTIEVAAAVFSAGTYSWQRFLQVLQVKLDGPMCVKNCVYDETPVRLRLLPKKEQKTSKESTGMGLGNVGGDKSLGKVLQTSYSLGFLLEHRESGQMQFLYGNVPTCLQCLERTRGEDLAAAQESIISSIPGLDDVCELFDVSIDLTTADRYLANDKCERGLQQLHPNDTPHHYSCEVHKAAACTTWALRPLDADVSGMIAASLVLRNAGSLSKFRDTLMQVIRSSLVVNYAVCPTEPEWLTNHRAQVYDLFLSLNVAREDSVSGLRKQRATQRSILCHYLAGDLTDAARVEFFTHGVDMSEEQVLQILDPKLSWLSFGWAVDRGIASCYYC